MKEIVIIKLYRNKIWSADFNDLKLNKFEETYKNIKAFGEKIGKTVCFIPCEVLSIADFDCLAEITYNGLLSKDEKDFYEKMIKVFCQDGEIYEDGLEAYDLPLKIFYIKRDIKEA